MAAALFCPTLLSFSTTAQTKVNWVSTSQTEMWKTHKGLIAKPSKEAFNVEIQLKKSLQTIEGFGTCFNELGWTSLGVLSAKDRESILRELFAPGVGANFSICRMPVGANDFSRGWYSYDEMNGDFEMKHFSLGNDFETLIPFIRNAQKYNPSLRLWASPWSPPTWMKYNHHYAAKSILGDRNFKSEEWGMDMKGINNGLPREKEGKEGTDMFIQEDKYYKAYALYFAKFIEAYRQQKISIEMVMPQNEFNSPQIFPSCTWTPTGLSRFISYLAPQMQALGVDIFMGTMERADAGLIDTILTNPESGKFVKGVGFQWAGKGAIGSIHNKFPNLTLYQSEQECGNGKNDWNHCIHTWDLMKHYFNNGANAYMYWNTSLMDGGISTWGWHQNSLVSVYASTKTFKYNYEFYTMKHLSHFVKPGAKLLETSGDFNNLLAFINKDQSVVVVVQNDSQDARTLNIKIGDKILSPTLEANSFNTFLLKEPKIVN